MELDCRKAQQMINGYIADTLDERELQAFLDHVRECPSCYEELEIYYTIHLALDYLDDDGGAANPTLKLVRELDAKHRELYKSKVLQIIRNVLTAAALAAAILAAVIQINYLITGRLGLIFIGQEEQADDVQEQDSQSEEEITEELDEEKIRESEETTAAIEEIAAAEEADHTGETEERLQGN